MRKLLTLLTMSFALACPSFNGFKDDFSAPGLFKLLEPSPASAANIVLASLFMPRTAALHDAAPAPEDAPLKPVSIEQICRALAQAATTHDIPTGFLARLIWQESRFDPRARSSAGALGVAQFMPRTASAFGLDDPHDPITSLAASARFLRQLHDQFGNLGLAAAAYNAGSGRVSKWLKGENHLPTETENYVKIITGSAARRWTQNDVLDLHVALPRQAPCEGIEGLSRLNATSRLPVALSASATSLLAHAEATRQAQLARSARAKKTLMTRAGKASSRKVRAA